MTNFLLLADYEWLHYIFGPLLFMTSFFLIVVVLLQRGKGGGLVGALGGAGGQSAFGTKFGDRLMWVTYGIAIFWMILILATILMLSKPSDPYADDDDAPTGRNSATGALDTDPTEEKKDEADKTDAPKTDAEAPVAKPEAEAGEKPDDVPATPPAETPSTETPPAGDPKPETPPPSGDAPEKPAETPSEKPNEEPKR
jgi:preprotein translocase subunit SecG